MLLSEVNHRAKNSLAVAASSSPSKDGGSLTAPCGPYSRRPRTGSMRWPAFTTCSAIGEHPAG